MTSRLANLAVAVALTVTALPAWSDEHATVDLDQVVANVNGVDITLGHMAVAKSTLPEQYRQLPADVLFPGILDQLIQQTVLGQSYEGEWPMRITLALDNETRSLIAAEVVEGILADALKPGLVEKFYQERYENAEQSLEYNAAHILVETEEEALQIKTDLDEGADFAQTARDKSTGPSGPRGGDLGWFGPGVMVPSFEAAVLELEEGQISAPIETQFGWHVIKLMDRRNKEAPQLAEVRQELEQAIRQQAVEDQIKELLDAAKVDRSGAEGIDPGVLDQIDLSK